MIATITKFYKEIFNRQISLKHLYPKRKEHKLPKFLTLEEVKQVLDATENLKHKAILTTIYSCGLRLSEVLELQISDIKTKDHLLLIRQSKGNKDKLKRKILYLFNSKFMSHKFQDGTFIFKDSREFIRGLYIRLQ